MRDLEGPTSFRHLCSTLYVATGISRWSPHIQLRCLSTNILIEGCGFRILWQRIWLLCIMIYIDVNIGELYWPVTRHRLMFCILSYTLSFILLKTQHVHNSVTQQTVSLHKCDIVTMTKTLEVYLRLAREAGTQMCRGWGHLPTQQVASASVRAAPRMWWWHWQWCCRNQAHALVEVTNI